MVETVERARTTTEFGSLRRFWLTIAIIVAMMAAVIGGFVALRHQQAHLAELRENTRVTRMARQALMEANIAVLNVLSNHVERLDLSLYNAALARLATHADSHFPKSISLHGLSVDGMPIVRSLTAAWANMIPALHRGEWGTAREIYAKHDVHSKIEGLTVAFHSELEGVEAEYAAILKQFELTSAAVFLMLVLAGLFCICAFALATRRGTRESRARSAALAAADASREKVAKLFEMTDVLQSASDHSDANAVLRATVAELIPGYGGALYVFNNSRDRLVLSTTWEREGGEALPDAIGLQQCWSLKRGKPHINVPGSHKLCCEHVIGSDCILEIPMTARGEILGLLQIFASGPDAEERLREVQALGSALADAMSLALANLALRDKLRSQALRDPLTGLYNRRYMEDALQRLAGLADRDKTELSVIMIDLDHFKRLNDNYGHAKGDSVLRDAAAILLNQVRETDVACRYGGEELIVVLPNCGVDMALTKAEKLRASIQALTEPNGAQVSASLGVAAIPTTSQGMRELLAAADAALYEAKQAGRNRVVAAASRSNEPQSLTLIAAE